jgi:hypothetical protein
LAVADEEELYVSAAMLAEGGSEDDCTSDEEDGYGGYSEDYDDAGFSKSYATGAAISDEHQKWRQQQQHQPLAGGANYGAASQKKSYSRVGGMLDNQHHSGGRQSGPSGQRRKLPQSPPQQHESTAAIDAVSAGAGLPPPLPFDFDAFLSRLHGINTGLLQQHHQRAGMGESGGGWELNYARNIPIVLYNDGVVVGGAGVASGERRTRPGSARPGARPAISSRPRPTSAYNQRTTAPTSVASGNGKQQLVPEVFVPFTTLAGQELVEDVMGGVLPDTLFETLRRFPAGDAIFEVSDRRENAHNSHTDSKLVASGIPVASSSTTMDGRWCVDVGNLQDERKGRSSKGGGFATQNGAFISSRGLEPMTVPLGKENHRRR